MRTHERRDGEMERRGDGEMDRGGDGGVAVMTDPSPTVSSLTFRIVRERWTPGGRMKHTDATHTNTHTHIHTNNAGTKIELVLHKDTRVRTHH